MARLFSASMVRPYISTSLVIGSLGLNLNKKKCVFLALLTSLFSPFGAWAADYRLEAHYDPADHSIFGEVEVVGGLDPALQEKIPWFLPANRFEAPIDIGGDLLFRRVFPAGFDPGYTEVDGQGRGAFYQRQAGRKIAFYSKIPHRFGLYGHHQGRLVLEGGWFPRVGHPAADLKALQGVDAEAFAPMDVDLTLHFPAGYQVWLNGQSYTQFPIHLKMQDVSLLSLMAAPSLPERVLAGRRVVGKLASRHHEGLLEAALLRFEAFWQAMDLPEMAQPAPILLVDHRRYLGRVGEGQLFLSRRAMALHDSLISAHDRGVIHYLCAQRVHQLLSANNTLTLAERWFLADALAWRLGDYYLQWRAGGFDLAAVIKPLSILPGFDQLLYAPRFSFAQEVYGDPFLIDPLGESLRAVIDPGPPGRVLALKLADYFQVDFTEAALQALREGGTPWQAFLTAAGPANREAIEAFMAQWQGDYPHENLKLAREKGQNGQVDYWIERDGQSTLPPEAITLEIVAEDGEKTQKRWRAPAEKQSRSPTYTLPPGAAVEIDAERHILEVDEGGLILRGDNKYPRDWKFIVGGMTQAVDFQGRNFVGYMGLSYMPRYDRKHLISANLFADEWTAGGVTGAYYRYFGPARDGIWRRHRLGLEAGGGARRTGELGLYMPIFWGQGTYRYETRQDFLMPTSGVRLTASLRVGTLSEGRQVPLTWQNQGAGPCAGQENSLNPGVFGSASASALKLFPTGARGVMALRGRVDQGFGPGSEALYALGGAAAIRGLSPCEIRGAGRAIAGVEWRRRLIEDLNLDLRLFYARTLQGVLFVDGGRAWYSGALAFSAGGGLRLHLESLGIQPVMVGLDMAYPIWATGQGPLRYLLRFSQAF